MFSINFTENRIIWCLSCHNEYVVVQQFLGNKSLQGPWGGTKGRNKTNFVLLQKYLIPFSREICFKNILFSSRKSTWYQLIINGLLFFQQPRNDHSQTWFKSDDLSGFYNIERGGESYHLGKMTDHDYTAFFISLVYKNRHSIFKKRSNSNSVYNINNTIDKQSDKGQYDVKQSFWISRLVEYFAALGEPVLYHTKTVYFCIHWFRET